MVLRDKRISNKSDNVQLYVSFGFPDVKALMRLFVSTMPPECEAIIRTMQYTEQDIRYFFEHNGQAFLSFPDKWREQLSGWAFAVAVRNKFLVPTSTDENKYFLSDSLFVKRGRPRHEE